MKRSKMDRRDIIRYWVEYNANIPQKMSIPDVAEKYIDLLIENGYETIDDLKKADPEVLLAIDGIGPRTLQRILEYLEEVG